MVDNRIRERLTGAAILVALIVLLVPELLSRPQHAGVQLAAVADEAPIRSYRMSLGDSQQSAVPVTPVAPVGPATSGAPGAPATPGGAGTPPVAAGATVGTLPGTPARPPMPARIEPRVADATPPAHRAAAPVRQARAESAATDRAPHAESVAGEWAVQVGSFGSRENADRLVHSLKLKGYGAFITESPSRGRKWYRVRVGPERNRAAAEAIATRLRATGLRGAVAQAR